MDRLLAIDPGPVQSAFVLWDDGAIREAAIVPNEELMQRMKDGRFCFGPSYPCVIEQVASYGMPVGAEIFETVFWSGRFAQQWMPAPVHRIPRLRVKQHLCHDSRAKDANIRQALIDKFGAPGTKNNPGLLYGVKADIWAALALAVTYREGYA